MYIQINQEDLFEVENLKNDIKQGKVLLLNSLKNILIILRNIIKLSITNFSEYSIPNIRKYGLKDILYQRALRFFKLERKESESKKNNSALKPKSMKKKISLRAILRLIFLPFYYIILFILWIKNKNAKKIKHKNFQT